METESPISDETVRELLNSSEIYANIYQDLQTADGRRLFADPKKGLIVIADLVTFVLDNSEKLDLVDERLNSVEVDPLLRYQISSLVFAEMARLQSRSPEDKLRKVTYFVGTKSMQMEIAFHMSRTARQGLQRVLKKKKIAAIKREWQTHLEPFAENRSSYIHAGKNGREDTTTEKNCKTDVAQKAAGLNEDRLALFFFYLFAGCGREVPKSKQAALIECLFGYKAKQTVKLYSKFTKEKMVAANEDLGPDKKFFNDIDFARKRFEELGLTDICKLIERDIGGEED